MHCLWRSCSRAAHEPTLLSAVRHASPHSTQSIQPFDVEPVASVRSSVRNARTRRRQILFTALASCLGGAVGGKLDPVVFRPGLNEPGTRDAVAGHDADHTAAGCRRGGGRRPGRLSGVAVGAGGPSQRSPHGHRGGRRRAARDPMPSESAQQVAGGGVPHLYIRSLRGLRPQNRELHENIPPAVLL